MYRYVGPADLVSQGRPGHQVHAMADLESWLAGQATDEPFTFVIDTGGVLRLAPRRSEHVACAEGQDVLGAGEMAFARDGGRWVVSEVSNQSTGYCPDVTSWLAVAEVLDRLGLQRPDGFTHELVFRRCPACREVGIVRDSDFVCVFCGAELPEAWNVS